MVKSILFCFLTFLTMFSEVGQASSVSCTQIFSDPTSILEKRIFTKPITANISQTANDALEWISGSLLTKINERSSLPERFAAISSLPVAYLIAAPGHNILRNRAQINSLKDYIKNNDQGNFQNDKILLNIITDPSGKIVSVDIWNAHHRLIAYSELNYKAIGDLKISNLELLVNGVTDKQASWNHFVPAAGMDPIDLMKYPRVNEGYGIQPNTISVPGNVSNYQIGSRTTIKDLTSMPARSRKVAVYFGTFDPIHEGHIATAKGVMGQFGLDEVVFIHNVNPLHKPNATSSAHRFEMVNLRIKSEPGLNAYQGDSNFIISKFGKDLLIDQLKQVYASENIFEILGDDAYQKLLNLNQLSAKDNRQYIVMPRTVNSPFQVPEHLKNIVNEANYVEGLSSTLIRNKIKNGEDPQADELSPELYDYIKKFKLYFYSADTKRAS